MSRLLPEHLDIHVTLKRVRQLCRDPDEGVGHRRNRQKSAHNKRPLRKSNRKRQRTIPATTRQRYCVKPQQHFKRQSETFNKRCTRKGLSGHKRRTLDSETTPLVPREAAHRHIHYRDMEKALRSQHEFVALAG